MGARLVATELLAMMEDRVLLLLLMKFGFAFRPVGFLGGASVIHPVSFGRKPSKSSLCLGRDGELWEDHGACLVYFLCWPRALGRHERVQLTGAIGCRLVDWWLGRHGGPLTG